MGGSKPAVPAYPMIAQPMPPQSPPPYTPPPDYNAMIPQVPTAGQVIGQANQIENPNNTSQSLMPSLSLDPSVNPIASQADQQAYADAVYGAQINPMIAQERSNLALQGRDTSSFGGAELGQMLAQGATQKAMYGQQFYTNALNNLLGERNNFFGNSAQLAQNQGNANVARGAQVAQLNANANQQQNQYNLGTAQLGQQQYGTQANIYAQGNQFPFQSYALNLQNQQNRNQLLGGIIGNTGAAFGQALKF